MHALQSAGTSAQSLKNLFFPPTGRRTAACRLLPSSADAVPPKLLGNSPKLMGDVMLVTETASKVFTEEFTFALAAGEKHAVACIPC